MAEARLARIGLLRRVGDGRYAFRHPMVREALARLGGRCQEMIRLLFYKQPPLPYDEVAQHFGLATGSIGFIRGRCLKRLEKLLRQMGLH